MLSLFVSGVLLKIVIELAGNPIGMGGHRVEMGTAQQQYGTILCDTLRYDTVRSDPRASQIVSSFVDSREASVKGTHKGRNPYGVFFQSTGLTEGRT